MSGRVRHVILGGLVTLVMVLATATFSARPVWQSLPEDHALVRLSLTVSGVRNCRDRTADELAKLPPNMRRAQVCDRRRAPVWVEMALDGEVLVDEEIPPTGLAGSGPSRIYRRFEVPAGRHRILLRLRRDPAADEDTARIEREVTVKPGQNLAIDYDSSRGIFEFH